VEIAGAPSATVTIDAKDVFAPAVPEGVAAVADGQARAIDLSWTPDTDADLAGYVVYRRDVTAGTAMERISGTALVVPPSFGDTAVVAGHRYAYAVSAVDQDGNESARSGEVVEEIPQ
jgi:fibronectin type 3 domain-containing protein